MRSGKGQPRQSGKKIRFYSSIPSPMNTVKKCSSLQPWFRNAQQFTLQTLSHWTALIVQF